MILTQTAPERIVADLLNPWPRCAACVPYHAVDANCLVEIEMATPGGEVEPELVPLCQHHFWTQLPALEAQHRGITPVVMYSLPLPVAIPVQAVA